MLLTDANTHERCLPKMHTSLAIISDFVTTIFTFPIRIGVSISRDFESNARILQRFRNIIGAKKYSRFVLT